MFWLISSWNIVISKSINIRVHFCWSNILLFSESFVSFWIRSVWKIWDLTFFSWKRINNTSNKSMNFFVTSFFTNVAFFSNFVLLSQSFVGFWIRSVWKIWYITFFSWKWFNNTCNKSMNFFIASFFSNITFFILHQCFM